MPSASSSTEMHLPSQLGEDDIVITGLSGLFPNCNNVKEFAEKLYNHENMVTNDKLHWDHEHPELSKYCGTIPDLDKFDAQFFMVHYHNALFMDPMSRKLLEHAYQAIFDAGVSVNELSGTKLGVFIGTSMTETEKISPYTAFGYGISGCIRAMFANRISFVLNAKGPSMTLDASCCGSLVCLEKAYEAIKHGDCEAAIVGGSNLHLHPMSCIQYSRQFRVNTDGKMKCFDKNADGPSQSECISVIFLQKAKDAKRIYATVCNVKFEHTPSLPDTVQHFGPSRDPSVLSTFYSKFYKDSNISPLDVEYIEAFGSAFPEADVAELKAIQDVFCNNRNDPLYIGSVMSNMGYSQASTTVAALTKLCLAYQTGKIPANLHYQTPQSEVPAISDGRLCVVTKNKSFSRSYTAVNSLSLTGINGHVLLKGRYKPKVAKTYKSKIPYLITVSGRHESAVTMIFEDLKSHPIDPEVIALFHNIYKTRVSKHLARGFTILSTDEDQKTMSVKEKVNYFDDAKRPLWFVFSGMGSQWNGMGKELLHLPVFAAAIQRCQEALKPMGVDLIYILTSDDKEIFENILNSFLGIAAVQIGLTDVLYSMGIFPDNIIGHSAGELTCAYADGCLTADQVILASYYRGLVSVQTPLIEGSMAAIGLGWQKIQKICPHDIEVACHNSAESCTISGPADTLHSFVDKLTNQGIFAKEVNCSNIAYHSRYIKDVAPVLLHHLKTVIKDPKTRSKRWLSTSVPKSRWEEPTAQMCSAEYHTNNLLNPVLFEEASEAIPVNAVLIEVAPHGLLQAILTRALPSACTNIPLTRRGHSDNAQFLLEAIGELYMVGYNPDVSSLYEKIEFPVSTETRSLSHLVKWAHDDNWKLPLYRAADKQHAATYDVTFSTHDDEFTFLRGHIIDGETLFPFAGALVMVWDILAMTTGVTRKELSVQFNEVHFHTQPLLSDNSLMKLSAAIHKGSGRFEVLNEKVLIATGYIKEATDIVDKMSEKNCIDKNEIALDNMFYSSKEVYRRLFDKGYDYRGEFRSIQKENADMTWALVNWNANWVTLIDAMIQMNTLKRECDIIEQPHFIQQLFIDVKHHAIAVETLKDEVGSLEAYYNEDERKTRCGGLMLENVLFIGTPLRKRKKLGLKTLQFVPYFGENVVDIASALYTMLQIIEENKESTMHAFDITENKNGSFLSQKINELLPELSSIKLNMSRMTIKDIVESDNYVASPDFILLDKSVNDVLTHVFLPNVFVIVLEERSLSQSFYKVVASAITPIGKLVLGRWRPQQCTDIPTIVSITSSQEITSLNLSRYRLKPDSSLYIVTQYPPMIELKNVLSQWRKKENNHKVHLAMVDKTSIENKATKNLDFDLAYGVLQNGTWGGYYYICNGKAEGKGPDTVILKTAQIGVLNSLYWTQATALKPKDILVTVYYASLNYYDAKKATGEVFASPEEVTDHRYGMDFSGLTARGERVMGVVRRGAAATQVAAEPLLLWPVPEHWTLEDAATVPLAYAHAFYCFAIKCKLNSDMTVLIHGAAGALGQAAISIALAIGCTVFTTVGDIKKKRFLINLFPKLNEDYVGCSRDYTFGDMVLEKTKGLGCDIIISSASGELKDIMLNCCAANGTTLDTQEVHSNEFYNYGMYNLAKSGTYIAINFSTIFNSENIAELQQLQLMVSDGIARGYVRPLSRVVYKAVEAARSLRLLASSRHRGKVLLHMHGQDLIVTNRLAVQPKGSNLVLASAEGDALAIRIVDLLIYRGAVNIMFHRLNTHECEDDAYLDNKITHWQKLGAKVKKSTGTLNETEKVQQVVKHCNSIGPLDGIYVIADSPDKTNKEIISRLLTDIDNVTKRTCPAIMHFAIINNNSDLGRNICINRRLEKLPGLMIKIPNSHKFNEINDKVEEESIERDSISLRNLMPYVENALCLTEPVIIVYAYEQKESLLDKILSITGLEFNVKTNNDKKTLHDLGLHSDKIEILLKLLHHYDVKITKEKIPRMMLSKLKSLQKKEVNYNAKQTGLKVLFSNGETNEIRAGSELIVMPTPVGESNICDDGFSSNKSYLVILPGMDGHYGNFKSICKRLKLSAVVCQPGFDHHHENISQMADRMAQVVLKIIRPKEKFYLLGYSFGVLVALEMAAILEKHGLAGIVYCVDASPDTFPSAMERCLNEAGATDTTKLQNAVVKHMYSLLVGSSSNQLASDLQKSKSWNDRIEAGVRLLKKEGHSMQYARSVIETAYARIVHTRQYNSQHLSPLQSQLVLLRCRSNPTASPDLGLSRYSKQKLHVYNLVADHANALEDLRCANIVNRHLDRTILNDFYNKNLCNTYMRNSIQRVDSVPQLTA